MSAESSRIKAELAFYEEVLPLEEELEAAREDKKNDPVRFAEAKQVFEEKRRFYREIAQFVRSSPESGTNIEVPGIDAGGTVPQIGGNQ